MGTSKLGRTAFILFVLSLILIINSQVVIAQAIMSVPDDRWMSLAGNWRFAIDEKKEGIDKGWFRTSAQMTDSIHLPGTMDENKKGPLNKARETESLTRVYFYEGPAWYQRTIDIPKSWNGKRIQFFMERTKWTRVWIDGNPLEAQDSLATPHLYELGKLAAGHHELTVLVDNSQYVHMGDVHQISNGTQTNWNGILGKIGLVATDALRIEDVQAYPDWHNRELRVRVELGNETGAPARGALELSVSAETNSQPILKKQESFRVNEANNVLDAVLPLDDKILSWDEFSPNSYRLRVRMSAKASGKTMADSRESVFGLREFKASGTQFSINGKITFLRGKHDAAVFPMTGYAPMDKAEWLRVFKIAQSYGINHYRFHSWCPPEAAFEAADELGIYLQPELPIWEEFNKPEFQPYLTAESRRIMRAFGNHPSFVMFSLGNELRGSREFLADFVKDLRAFDNRHLYAAGSNSFLWDPIPGAADDYFTTARTRRGGYNVRGSFGRVDGAGHLQTGPANTLKDYSGAIAGIKMPVIGHEIGQYETASDFREIPKYTGVLRAYNFESYRDRLREHGMEDQADDFFRASGALAVRCYREEIEAALRTPGFGGFQLLDLQDYPGQGTALVGILNAFMESKGLIEPAQWGEFMAPTVILAKFRKYTWTTPETFNAVISLAHYGPTELKNAQPVWTLRDSQQHVIASGKLSSKPIQQGGVTDLGEIRADLTQVSAPQKLQLEVALADTRVVNHYDIWVYPVNPNTAAGNVIVTRALDDKSRQALNGGATVLLMPEPTNLPNSIEGTFASDFWNWEMFKRISEDRKVSVAPGTLGILTDPKHPAFGNFPTDFHSDWQWFNLLMNSRAVIIDNAPANLRPIVQVIDNYQRAHRLAAIFEARVGKGRLLVCTIDLPNLQDRPEARQLLSSLLGYMNSAAFNPKVELDYQILSNILQ